VELGAQIVPRFTGTGIPELDAGIIKLLPQDALLKSPNGDTAAIRWINEEKIVKQMYKKLWIFIKYLVNLKSYLYKPPKQINATSKFQKLEFGSDHILMQNQIKMCRTDFFENKEILKYLKYLK